MFASLFCFKLFTPVIAYHSFHSLSSLKQIDILYDLKISLTVCIIYMHERCLLRRHHILVRVYPYVIPAFRKRYRGGHSGTHILALHCNPGVRTATNQSTKPSTTLLSSSSFLPIAFDRFIVRNKPHSFISILLSTAFGL